MIQFDHRVKVFYKDVDQMGIVYYSRYFEFFEEARTEMLSSIGLDYSDVEAQGVKLPVIEAYANYRKGAYFEQEIIIENEGIQLPVITSHCDYRKGAVFEQSLIVETFISDIPKAKLKIHYSVRPQNSDQVLVTGYTVHAFIKKTGRPARIPDFILTTIKQHFIK